VFDLALIDDGHRLEAAMRVLADAAWMRRRRELRRARVVEQQERTQVRAVAAVAEHRAHREAVPHPMGTRRAVDAKDLLHHMSFCGEARCPEPCNKNMDGPMIRVDLDIWPQSPVS
jgi:hypothetical protein